MYTPAPLPLSVRLKAFGIGLTGVVATFALLPILMEIPNPFIGPPVVPVKPVAEQLPEFIKHEEPIPIVEPDEIDKPVFEDKLPDVTIGMMESLLNPRDNGVKIAVDAGNSFVKADEEAFGVFLTSQLDKQPRVIVATKPLYPYSMQQSKTVGLVTVEFIIDETGRVIRPRIVKSSHREFEQAALEAVTKSKWQPGQKNGANVRTLVHQPIHFNP